MGKILTRTERSESEFPVVMTAAPVTDIALPNSAWLKANGGKCDINPDSHRRLTRHYNQDVNKITGGVIPTTANTIDELGPDGDSAEHEEKRKREVDSLPLERFVYNYPSFHYEIPSSPDYLRTYLFFHSTKELCPSRWVDQEFSIADATRHNLCHHSNYFYHIIY